MGLLCDRTIGELIESGEIGLEPYDRTLLQPASVDIRLDRWFRVFVPGRPIDPAAETDMAMHEVEDGAAFCLMRGGFALASTLERVRLPDGVAARVEGKSSIGRLGIMIHSTAGWIDPGFNGHITLEISNVAPAPVLLYPGMRIGQLAFMPLDRRAQVPYGHDGLASHYQSQARGPQPSRSWVGFSTTPTGLTA